MVYTITNIPAAQQKAVFFEEWTGVRCINCPEGHELVEQLVNTWGDRIIPCGLHPDYILAKPFNISTQNLISPDANRISTLYPFGSMPKAMIDRYEFSPDNFSYLTQQWGTHVSARMNETTPVNLALEAAQYNDTLYEVVVTVTYTQEVTNDNRVSVFVMEDNIQTAQLKHKTGGGDEVDTSYIHQHVLRRYLTDFKGQLLQDSKPAGTVIKKNFFFQLNSRWVPTNLYVGAFVHESGSSDIVYHATKTKLIP
jgi:hypothetical protein